MSDIVLQNLQEYESAYTGELDSRAMWNMIKTWTKHKREMMALRWYHESSALFLDANLQVGGLYSSPIFYQPVYPSYNIGKQALDTELAIQYARHHSVSMEDHSEHVRSLFFPITEEGAMLLRHEIDNYVDVPRHQLTILKPFEPFMLLEVDEDSGGDIIKILVGNKFGYIIGFPKCGNLRVG